jgi:cysteine synthase A
MEKNEILSLIGNTPLIELEGIFAKLETVNPTGSVKDRMALYMTAKAEERGELKPGDRIIEVTSGNTGISFAMISAIKGYKFMAVMPESMSKERREMMEAFGAEVVLTPAEKDMAGAVEEYDKIAADNPGAWLPRQFENPDNIAAHKEGLGREISKQMKGDVDALVAGVGTGGTLIGSAQYLKKDNPAMKAVAVEPEESSVLLGKNPGFHGIQGIGEGFIPKQVAENLKEIDEIVSVSTKEACKEAKRIARKYGLLLGVSSGANFLVAKSIKERFKFKSVVTIFPDRGERYLSQGLFNN